MQELNHYNNDRKQHHIRKAMILAAGLGTRLKPFTDKHPKALALVNGKSLLQRNIEFLQSNGITDVVVNTHHFAEQIDAAITKNNGWGSKVVISYEKDVLETGGGLLFASQYFAGEHDFVLMNADVLTDLRLDKMIEQHLTGDAIATLAISERTTSRYLLFTSENELCGWQNSNTGEVKMARQNDDFFEKAFSGIHVINSSIFEMMKTQFNGKFSMIDVYLKIAETQSVQGFLQDGCLLIDVGKPDSIAIAETLFP